ncbi:penicillin-binding transpeptidase domain-containing protein [Streptomyces sp. NPDC046939]|uniref:penicillin-binding transpeptidase domain-containing protein n=1 Tax=Streptomyces sp. NPDC046939 TaxID=3155376 RepID=UPI0033D0DA1B
MRKGIKVAIVGGVFTAMVGGAGYGAFNIVSAVSEDGGTSVTETRRSGPPTSEEIKETSRKFLAAWARNDAATAAGLTNHADSALPALTGWHDDAHVTRTVLTAGTPVGAKVPFEVKATVQFGEASRTLSYDSSLTVVRGLTTGRPRVQWQPSVLHPALRVGDTLVTGEAAAPPIQAVDRNGVVLSKEKYPSLGPVLETLRARYGDAAGGEPGVETYIERHDVEGTTTTKTLLTLAKGKPGTLRTTISASAQAAAERSAAKFPKAALVAVKPSTGEVLAVANHGYGAWNAAFEAKLAPGSTMKIITAAALIDNGVTSATGPAPCPNEAPALSQTFHNLQGMAPDENATLSSSFQRSCNTAFIKLSDDLGPEKFAAEAQDRFGLGKDWQTGIVSYDGSVPVNGDSDDPAGMIGQGKVTMNPLNMASVTATAITGTFRQPVLVPPSLGDRQLATARGLPASTVSQLKTMMRLTATSAIGTATHAMAGLTGDIGAKTGSAEVGGQSVSNSWFTGYRGDVAAAAMVEGGGHGGDAAGPIVASVLRAGS